MQKRDKWEQSIKKKLENHKTPVPDFIWNSLETELPKENIFRRNKSVIMNIAATAAIAIIIASAYIITINEPFENNKTATLNYNTENNCTKDININKTIKQPDYFSAKNKQKQNNKEILIAENSGFIINKKEMTIKDNETENKSLSENNDNTDENNSVNIRNEENEREETIIRDYSPLKKKKESSSYSNDSRYIQNSTKGRTNQKKKWSVALQAGNTYNSTSKVVTGFSAREANILLETNQISTYESMFLKTNTEQPETYTKHHFPVTGAITIKRYVTERLSVETGLQYTILRTDLTTGGENRIVKKQKFQYLGVPVKVNYDIINTKGFILYTSAGGTMEGCVSAKSYNEIIRKEISVKKETENINMKKIQFSVNAAIGLQFNPVSFMGIFAEPGISYFFNDGNNNISNIRQAHPFNFQLKAGIRFNI